MKAAHLAATIAAALIVIATPGVAEAATITRPFHADSGDSCRYGATDGTLGWQYGTTSPLPVTAVDVVGKIVDRPTPADPSTACRNDNYFSVATFVAYSGSVEVDRNSVRADNASVSFSFRLGAASTVSISRVEIQVCRHPLVTLPPSYCGPKVVYSAPPIG
jgi:hypothetical protein